MQIARTFTGAQGEIQDITDPVSGDVFVAQDVEKVFQHNGTEWSEIPSTWDHGTPQVSINNIRIVKITEVNATL